MSTVSPSSSTGFVVPVVTATPATPTSEAPAQSILPLEQGDRLTRAEFERRYEAMPELKKAELIEGVVYMPSPVRFPQHGKPNASLVGWLFVYEANTPGVASGDNTTLKLDNDNMPQPDALMVIHPALGGQARIDADGYIEGAPELIAEIAASAASIDLGNKFRVYRRNGVREYIVWRVYDRAIDWFVLRDSEYQPLAVGEDGTVRSEVFPGLWLNVPAMLDGRLDVVIATLQLGLQAPEHQQFAAELASRAAAQAGQQPAPKHGDQG
jgi:Uma2 family endonuclease